MNETDNLDVYQSTNTVGIKNLAEQADFAGLKTPVLFTLLGLLIIQRRYHDDYYRF